MTQKIIHQI